MDNVQGSAVDARIEEMGQFWDALGVEVKRLLDAPSEPDRSFDAVDERIESLATGKTWDAIACLID